MKRDFVATRTEELGLPPGWKEATLADIVEPRIGKMDPRSDPETPFIGMEQLEAHTMRLLGTVRSGTMKSAGNVFYPWDVLYSRLRSYLNKVYQPDFAGMCSGEFIVLPETTAVLGRFLKYRLNSGEFVRFASRINTGDRPRVDFEQIKTFRLALPPRAEQARMADALDELLSDLDAGGAALERARAKLKLYRASVLKAAVEGALTAEWRAKHPHAEPASELLKRILVERRRRWEEDQLAKFKAKGQEPPKNWKAKYKEPVAPDTTHLPPLPEGWSWVCTEGIADVVDPQPSHRTPPQVAKGVAYVGMGDVDQEGKVDFASARQVSWDVLDEHRGRYALREGDFMFGKIGTLGKPVLLLKPFEYTLSANVVLVQPHAMLAPGFLLGWMQSPGLQRLVHVDTKATSQPAYGIQKVRLLPVPLAPLAEQEAIVEAVEDQLSVVNHLEADIAAKLKSAQALRQSILRHAFTGRLVPQDPNDEPASELLKRIAAEREAQAGNAAVGRRGQKRAPKPPRSPFAKGGRRASRKGKR